MRASIECMPGGCEVRRPPGVGEDSMKRRKFLNGSVAGLGLGATAALPGAAAAQGTSSRQSDLPAKFTPAVYANEGSQYNPFATPDYYQYADDLVIERRAEGKPHAGKVLGRRRVPSGLVMANQASYVEYHPLGVVGDGAVEIGPATLHLHVGLAQLPRPSILLRRL